MADTRSIQFNAEPMFVSPERLVLDNDMNAFQPEDVQQQNHHHQTNHQQQQRPSLPLHTMSDWSVPTHHSLRNLPPTPISPFRPLRPLSEDEKLAFPCTGDADSCWNLDLCPKHRQDSPKPQQQQQLPEQHHQPNPRFNHTRTMSSTQIPQIPNPRRRSAPTSDLEPPPAKMKRNATEPEEVDQEMSGTRHSYSSLNRMNPQSRGRVPHNLVERRYRDNLNNQIESLRLTLPSLKDAQPCTDITLEDTSSPRMPSKAVIISTAATYIKDMENERTRLLAANKALQEQVSGLQKLVRCDDCNVLQYLNTMNLAVQLPTPS
ncbi:hypothetical protein PRZ48_002294 [Zasmidium cellare]|uniref:BHLH domain-containing protein n=1 Tax=Zasmidium cellare TaxID=395010 RepID=A0ABR0F5F2_ZASCE|nr:hypothetical protein PRZ48_002294 [Zasmidium cellare]